MIENITAHEDVVSVQLYGHPWVIGESWPMTTPCFRLTAVDDTGVEHEGGPASGSASPAYEGSGLFWFWPQPILITARSGDPQGSPADTRG